MQIHAALQHIVIMTVLIGATSLISGCGENAADKKKKADAELVAQYDNELKNEIEQHRKDAEKLEMRAEIERQMKENRQTISKLTLDSMARRSQFEGVVAEAILTLDSMADIDDQTKKLMEGSNEWYAAYRECESPGYMEHNGLIRHMIIKGHIDKVTNDDERIGAFHALVDFIEQYRQGKDELAKEIETRFTSLEGPSDSYKSAYKAISAMVFEQAADGEDNVEFDFSDASYEDLMAADARYPLFPKGSRFVDKQKEQQIEDERLFGK